MDGPAPTSWLQLFRGFIGNLTISSKETGLSKLKPYGSQRMFMKEVASGLDEGIRDFTILKARQLGISTYALTLDLFWLSAFPGTQGALVADNEGNREQFRDTLARYHESLPKALRFNITKHNRELLTLSNGSVLHYLVAGSKSKGGGLGRGRGINFLHATEMSSWGDPEGIASLRASLAENHPARLYLWESTARGYNAFWDMWQEAKEAVDQKAIFIGWWAKEPYRLVRGSKKFNAVWDDAGQTEREKELSAEVKKLYGVKISDEQWAWWRHKNKELMGEGQGFGDQEFPTTEEQAFLMTGKPFFPRVPLKVAIERSYEIPFKGYRYHMGEDFTAMEIEQVTSLREIELRVWEEPQPNGVYVLGADPAYGTAISENNWNDNFVVQVLRCYADRVVQVAEYSVNDIAPHQFAWAIAHIAGWYKNTRLVLEISGPGVAVWQEVKHLRNELMVGHRAEAAKARGVQNTLATMANYLYMRQDSFGSGALLHFKTNADLKLQIMSRLKDAMILKAIDIASLPCLQEMQKVVNDGGWIGGAGRAKDDKPLALALAVRGYDDWVRAYMNAEGRTLIKERDKEKQMAAKGKGVSFAEHIVQDFFRTKEQHRLHRDAIGMLEERQVLRPGKWNF